MELKLPIGIQSFEELRKEGYYYVDKTPFIKKLIDSGKYFFLSRPRRFGKSLFLDTIRQAFLGKKELFKGLYLENYWDWSQKYPVIYISFGSGVIENKKILLKTIESILKEYSEEEGIELKEELFNKRFFELIKALFKKYQQKVVVLIDEYDKPILDKIEDKEEAIKIREVLKNFYSVLKDADPYLKFVFITGVSKFSKVSLFSGLNNLQDITLHPEYGTICGYTQKEFEEVFADRLKGVDLEEIKKWYNGYSWLNESVYCPFDVLLFLDTKIFRPYWFETGTPTFLIKLLFEKKFYLPELEDLRVSEKLIESFDVEEIEPETLLFQTGYLTIKEVIRKNYRRVYRLTYPNMEVKVSLNDYLLDWYTKKGARKERELDKGYDALETGDLEKLKEVFVSLFAGIPSEWYRKSEIAEYEGYYGSVVYSYFTALGIEVRVEDATNVGRLDMAVFFKSKCYFFEFKVAEKEPKGNALKQLKEKKYYEKYIANCKEIYLIGIEFSKTERNVVNFEWEKLN